MSAVKAPVARRLAAPLLLLVLVLAATGCTAIKDTLALCTRITDAGGNCRSVSFENPGNRDRLIVSTGGPTSDGSENLRIIEQVSWTTFPYRFDDLVVDGSGPRLLVPRSSLQERFGERPAKLDERGLTEALTDGAVEGFRVALIAGAIVFVVVVAGVILLIVLVRKSRAKKRLAMGAPMSGPPPGYQPPGFGGGWNGPPPQQQPQPGPPPGWSPPPPTGLAPEPPAPPQAPWASPQQPAWGQAPSSAPTWTPDPSWTPGGDVPDDAPDRHDGPAAPG